MNDSTHESRFVVPPRQTLSPVEREMSILRAELRDIRRRLERLEMKTEHPLHTVTNGDIQILIKRKDIKWLT